MLTPNTECALCGKQVYRSPDKLEKQNEVYCSKRCQGIGFTKGIVPLFKREKRVSYSQDVFEIWVEGKVLVEHTNYHQWGDYRVLKYLRTKHAELIADREFYITKRLKAAFHKVPHEEVPIMWTEGQYSNHSHFRIAK